VLGSRKRKAAISLIANVATLFAIHAELILRKTLADFLNFGTLTWK
jgi:hypothetical protein